MGTSSTGTGPLGSVLIADAEGPTVSQQITAVSPAAPSASVAGGTVIVPTANMDGASVTYDGTGFTGTCTLAFYWSPDGVNYWPTFGQRQDLNAALINTGALAATRQSWLVDAPASTFVQVRAVVWTAGGVNPTVTMTPSSAPMAPQTVGVVIVSTVGAVISGGSNINASGVFGGAQGLITYSAQAAYNGATTDVLRTPSKFFTATATAAGDTAVWTPTSGKKPRVMSYSISITADAATAGGADIDIVLRDGTAAIGATGFSVFVPAIAATTFGNTDSTGWIDLGNGFLAAAANDVINVNLSAALTSGKVRVNVCGTEE